MRLIATLTLAIACASLAGCTPPQSAGSAVATADTTLTRAEADYATAKAVADMLLPILPADKAARVTAAERIAAEALAAARAAVTLAEQLIHVRQAQAATAQIEAVTSAPVPLD